MTKHSRVAAKLQMAATGLLVVTVALLVLSAVGRRVPAVAATSLAPDSTTADRLSGPAFDELPSPAMAAAPTAGQKAALLAAALLLSPTLYNASLPLVLK